MPLFGSPLQSYFKSCLAKWSAQPSRLRNSLAGQKGLQVLTFAVIDRHLLFTPFFFPLFPLFISCRRSIRCSLKRTNHSLSFLLVSHFLLILAALTFSLLSFRLHPSNVRASRVYFPVPPAPFTLIDSQHHRQPPTGFLPDHSYPSVPHFPFPLFPPLSLLMPSCGVTGVRIDGNTWPRCVSVCHGSSASTAQSLWL